MEAGDEKPTQLVIRSGRWKLIQVRSSKDRRAMNNKEVELYDVHADPGEHHDLARKESAIVEKLAARLRLVGRVDPFWQRLDADRPGRPRRAGASHAAGTRLSRIDRRTPPIHRPTKTVSTRASDTRWIALPSRQAPSPAA